ncbi:hypothetical protein [Pseudomonas sp. TE50-2]|uniref:hypothetical protein n=1 Tax=Pseudomonas sp. TE50-2 TaxID=3142707 RepID=UPI003467CE8D
MNQTNKHMTSTKLLATDMQGSVLHQRSPENPDASYESLSEKDKASSTANSSEPKKSRT